MLVCIVLLTGCQLTNSSSGNLPERDLPYSFSHPPYIHPRIVQDLSTWISDTGDQVIGINLIDSQDSNRYYGDILVKEVPAGPFPFVYVEEHHSDDEATPYFGYRYIGSTESGIHVLRTAMDGGGSGVFVNLLFLSIQRERGAAFRRDDRPGRPGAERIVLHKTGEVALGDRWEGDLRVEGNKVFIGEDRGWFSGSRTTHGGHTLSIIDASQQGN